MSAERQVLINADQHIFIGALERSATHWVTRTLQSNVLGSPKNIKHELLRDAPVRMFHQWQSPGLHITVCQNMCWLPTLLEKFPDLQVAFLFREPIDNALSIVSNYGGRKDGAHALFQASMRWGAYEHALRQAEKIGIEASYWHFDYYTTEPGIIDLANQLGISVAEEIDMSAQRDATETKKRIYREQLPAYLITEMLKVFEKHTYLRRAYDKAKSYADEKLGR